MEHIYFDNAATTPVDGRVLEKMLPYFTDKFGNPNSQHWYGRETVAVVDEARDTIAKLIGAKPAEIYFTSGGTEADNWALRGAAHAYKDRGRHLIVSAVEHPAMIATAKELIKEGFDVTFAEVDEYGKVDLERLKKAIDKEDVKVVQCKAVEELVRNSDIICTTTPSTTPVLPDDKELLRGKCIIAIGSYMPEMREIPDAVLDLVDNVYIELPYACEESGDLSQPLASGKLTKDRIKLMHEYLVSGEKEIKEGQTTYFKSVGMGLFDVCIAQKLYEVAKEK